MTRRALVPLIVLGIALFVALSLGVELYFRLAYILGLALVGGFLMVWLNLRWLSVKVERRTSYAQVGSEYEEEITLENKGRFPKLWIEVEELTDLPGHSTGRVLHLPGKRNPPWSLEGPPQSTWKVATPCRRRGVFHVGPLRVASRDPLAFFKMERYFGDRQQVVVYPAMVPLPRFSLPLAELPGDGRWHQRTPYVTPLASSIREYRYGDGVNRIHWPSTARLGTLMVKEFDVGLSSSVWVILDLDQEVHLGEAEEATDELAATIAASAARHFLLQGLPVGLVSHGEARCILPPDRGYAQVKRVLEHLALLGATGRVPLEKLLREEERRFGRYDSLLVVTPSSRVEWIRPLGDLRRRGVVVSVVLLDASSFGGQGEPATLLERLAGEGVALYLVRKGQPLAEALARPLSPVAAGAVRFLPAGALR